MGDIRECSGFEKIGEFILNLNSSNTLWNFKSKDKRKGSHIYLLVVNTLIKKIGCSVSELRNCAGYGVGNGGRPSDRTTGIHYYIAKELKDGNKVYFYARMCPKIDNIEIFDIFNQKSVMNEVYIEPKIVESHYLKNFVEKYKMFPEWNKQEQGRECDWPISIKQIRNALCNKIVIKYENEHIKCPYMMLYHWKRGFINEDER